MLFTTCQAAWKIMWMAVNVLFDNTFGEIDGKRIKTVWALSGLFDTPFLDAKNRLHASPLRK
jgi:hypothetical protein